MIVSQTLNKVQRISTRFNDLMNHTVVKKVHEKMLRNSNYVVGNMLTEEVRKQLKLEGRIPLEFQLTDKELSFIAGVITRDRKSLRAVPLRIGDEKTAEMHTVIVDTKMYNCGGYDEIAKASLQAAIYGIGWVNAYYSYKDSPTRGKLIVRSEDPFSIIFDIDAKTTDQSDWRYMAKHGLYTAEDIINLYIQNLEPEMIETIRSRAEEYEGVYRKDQEGKPVGTYERWGLFERFNAENPGMNFGIDVVNNLLDARNGLYRVIEWHDRRTIIKQNVVSPVYGTSEPVPESLLEPNKKAEYDEFITSAKSRHANGRIETIPIEQLWISVAIPALLHDKLILEQPYKIQERGYQYKPIFWKDYSIDLTKTMSLIDILIAPNDIFNHRQMTNLYLMRKYANPDLWYADNSIAPNDLEDWKAKAIGKILRFTGAIPPSEHAPDPNAYRISETQGKEMVEIMQSIGSYSPNLGGRSETSNEPASLYAQRVEQGMVLLAHPFGNIYRSMRLLFNYVDRMLQEYMPQNEMIRLLEEPPEEMEGVVQEGESYWMHVNQETLSGVKNDIRQGEFDFRVDLANPSMTEKRVNTMLMLEIAKEMAAAGQPTEYLWYLIVKTQDFPEAKKAAEFLKKRIIQKLGDEEFARQQTHIQAQLQNQMAVVGALAPPRKERKGVAA